MLFERIQDIIVDQLGVSIDEITVETQILGHKKVDSLELFLILHRIEDEFDIKFEIDIMQHITTVGDVVESTQNCINNK